MSNPALTTDGIVSLLTTASQPSPPVWQPYILPILAGCFAGVIGLVSAVLSYSLARRQSKSQERENERNRQYQAVLLSYPKRVEAAELIWRTLFMIERGAELSEEYEEKVITAVLYLPDDLRGMVLQLVDALGKSEDLSITEGLVREVREKLVELSGLDLVDAARNTRRKEIS